MNAFLPGDELVCLTAAAHSLQAHIWENALRSAGIRAQVVGDNLDSGIGGVPSEIWIRRQDFVQARTLLQL